MSIVPIQRDGAIPSGLIDVCALSITVVLAAVVVLDADGVVRGLLALLFVTFVPGWAVVTNWTSAAALSRIALAVLLSLTICTAVATIGLWLDLWHPLGSFYAVASVSAAGIVSGTVRRRAHADRT